MNTQDLEKVKEHILSCIPNAKIGKTDEIFGFFTWRISQSVLSSIGIVQVVFSVQLEVLEGQRQRWLIMYGDKVSRGDSLPEALQGMQLMNGP